MDLTNAEIAIVIMTGLIINLTLFYWALEIVKRVLRWAFRLPPPKSKDVPVELRSTARNYW